MLPNFGEPYFQQESWWPGYPPMPEPNQLSLERVSAHDRHGYILPRHITQVDFTALCTLEETLLQTLTSPLFPSSQGAHHGPYLFNHFQHGSRTLYARVDLPRERVDSVMITDHYDNKKCSWNPPIGYTANWSRSSDGIYVLKSTGGYVQSIPLLNELLEPFIRQTCDTPYSTPYIH